MQIYFFALNVVFFKRYVLIYLFDSLLQFSFIILSKLLICNRIRQCYCTRKLAHIKTIKYLIPFHFSVISSLFWFVYINVNNINNIYKKTLIYKRLVELIKYLDFSFILYLWVTFKFI